MQTGVTLKQPLAPRSRRTPLGISADVGGQNAFTVAFSAVKPYGNVSASPCGAERLTLAATRVTMDVTCHSSDYEK
jgi:hypothetical protein